MAGFFESMGSNIGKWALDQAGSHFRGSNSYQKAGSGRQSFYDAGMRGLGQSAGSAWSSFNTPGAAPITDPTQAGRDRSAYMNAAFPGTNPWEQLGGNTGSYNNDAGGQGKVFRQEDKLQGKKLGTDKEIAFRGQDTQYKAAIDVAKIHAGQARLDRPIKQQDADTRSKRTEDQWVNEGTQARSAYMNAKTNVQRALHEKRKIDAEVLYKNVETALRTGNPASGAAVGSVLYAIKAGMTAPEFTDLIKNNMGKLAGAGIGGNIIDHTAKILGEVFVRMNVNMPRNLGKALGGGGRGGRGSIKGSLNPKPESPLSGSLKGQGPTKPPGWKSPTRAQINRMHGK